MSWNRKATDKEVMECFEKGMTAKETAKHLGLSAGWANTEQARRLRDQVRCQTGRKKRTRRPEQVVTYILPLDEIEKRYGRCGENQEKKPYTFIGDEMG